MDEIKINPWEVSGNFDDKVYTKIVNDFGAKLIDDKLLGRLGGLTHGLHPFLEDKTFFAHRDLDLLLDAFENGEEFYLYTGRGPSGDMHLGHLMPFLFTKWLQDKFGVHLVIQLTDDEKYLVKDLSEGQISKFTYSNVVDILSLGFQPANTHIIIDSIHAKTLYNNAIKVARHLTASTVKGVFGLTDSDNVGKFFFTSMQSVPAFLVSVMKKKNVRCLIPYAIDQDDHFKIARDILPKIGFYKPASIISKFLPSLAGNSKMSASDKSSAIYLSDDAKTVRHKIVKYAFSGGRDTADEQRKYGANPDVDFSFNTYKLLESDKKKVQKIYSDYRSGKMLSGEMKELAVSEINGFLERVRANRAAVEEKFADYLFDEENPF